MKSIATKAAETVGMALFMLIGGIWSVLALPFDIKKNIRVKK